MVAARGFWLINAAWLRVLVNAMWLAAAARTCSRLKSVMARAIKMSTW